MCAAEWFISPRRRHCLETKGLRQGGNKTENKSHCCLKQRFHICFVAPSTGIQREHVVILGLQIDEDSCRQSQVSQCYTKVVAMAQNWPHWKLWLEAVQCTPCGVSQKRRQNVGSAMWTPTQSRSNKRTTTNNNGCKQCRWDYRITYHINSHGENIVTNSISNTHLMITYISHRRQNSRNDTGACLCNVKSTRQKYIFAPTIFS